MATLTMLLFVKIRPETLCSVQSGAMQFFFLNCQSASSWELQWLRTASVPSVLPSRGGWGEGGGVSSVAWWDIPLSSFLQHHHAESRAEGECARKETHAPRQCVAVKPCSHARAQLLRSRTCFAPTSLTKWEVSLPAPDRPYDVAHVSVLTKQRKYKITTQRRYFIYLLPLIWIRIQS